MDGRMWIGRAAPFLSSTQKSPSICTKYNSVLQLFLKPPKNPPGRKLCISVSCHSGIYLNKIQKKNKMVVRDMHIRRIYNEIENGILYSCIIASWLYNVINCETVTAQHSAAAALWLLY